MRSGMMLRVTERRAEQAIMAARAGKPRRTQSTGGEDVNFFRRLLASSRFFIGFAVLGSFISAVVLVIYGFIVVAETTWHAFVDGHIGVDGAKHLAVEFVEMIDVFLLGTVLYIVALGLYELFVEPDLPMPEWLHIRDIDDLKAKLVGVVIVLMAVSFLTWVVDWNGTSRILYLGAAIALVTFALAISQYVTARLHQLNQHAPVEEEDQEP